MAPMTAAERQRKYREKLKEKDPEKLKVIKQENATRTKENYKKISILPENKQIEQRRKWRQQKRKKGEEIKINQPEKPKTDQKRKVRYILKKENFILKATVQRLTKIVRAQRKAIWRYTKKIGNLKQELITLTENNNTKIMQTQVTIIPQSKTEQNLNETLPDSSCSDKKKVKKAIFENFILKESFSSQYAKAETKSEKDVLKNLVNNDIVNKYKMKTSLSHSYLGLKGRLRQNKKALQTKRMQRMKEIQDFLVRNDNSRITAGKRDTKTLKKDKRQVRYLLDTLQNLHKKYMDEGGLASYSTFTRYKPFYVLDPTITQRNTCACVKHANLIFLAQKLKILGVLKTDNLEQLVSAVVCDKFDHKCMYSECQICENKTISFDLREKNLEVTVFWNAWVTKKHEYIKKGENQETDNKKTKRTTKTVIEATLATLIKTFSDQLKRFKKHFFNIYHAYKMYNKCKDTLSDSECIIHCDFSQNYVAKMSEEVQATHFGVSKQQFTLHTGVVYLKKEEGLIEKSFCTISPNNNHGPIAIWAHLTPILNHIKTKLQNITTVHFFSDGPTTQYRQKGNFYLMTEMIKKLGFKKSTWSFFESAHGKGAADGIGGAVKRILDKKVTYGKDIVDARTAYDVLVKCQSKILYFYVSDENIKTVEQDMNLIGLIPVPHTMDIHQVITTDQANVIKFRILACFCANSSCQCFGLEEHNLKIKKQKRKVEEKKETKRKTNKRSRLENYTDENEGKKIILLSEIKNTPENYRYFNLNNYGPLTLHKTNNIQIRKENNVKHIYENSSSSTAGVEQKNTIKEVLMKENMVPMQYDCIESKEKDTNENLRLNTKTIIDAKVKNSDYKEENDTEEQTKLQMQIDDFEVENSNNDNSKIPERENENEEPHNIINDLLYNLNYSVLVRYYERKSWVYYIGFIEGIETKTGTTYYNIRFLKSIKTPYLKFVTPKKVDKDTVPAEYVVKTIDLNYFANEFRLKNDCDRIYFQ